MWSRLVLVLVLVAGCGRLQFDPRSDAAGSAGDGAANPDTTATVDAGPGFDITTPTCPLDGFTLLGNTACMPGVIELTADAMNEVGAIWLTNPIFISSTTSFSIELTIQISHDAAMGNTPGDGMTIVVQHDPRGLAAIGGTGGQLGYENMTPSSAVELDTFKGVNDTYPEEIGIDGDGNTNNELVVVAAPFSLSGGTPFTVWIDYTGSTHMIAVFMAQSTTKPAAPLAMQTDDLSRLGAAWFGLTASTAASSESHHILRWKLTVMP